jgi:hypothetical protein
VQRIHRGPDGRHASEDESNSSRSPNWYAVTIRNCEILTRTQAHGEIWRAALREEATAAQSRYSRATEASSCPWSSSPPGLSATGSALPSRLHPSMSNELWVGHPPPSGYGPFLQTFSQTVAGARLSDPLIAARTTWASQGNCRATCLGTFIKL